MSRFLVSGKVIPEPSANQYMPLHRLFPGGSHGSILKVGLWVALLSVYEDRKLRRVTEKEDWSVVENPVPIAFLRIEFDGEASRISRRIGAAFLSSHSREASNALCLLPHTIEHIH